jgi:hypothetical protein
MVDVPERNTEKNLSAIKKRLKMLGEKLQEENARFLIDFTADDKYLDKPTVRLSLKSDGGHSDNVREFIKTLSMYITIVQLKMGVNKHGNEESVVNKPVPFFSSENGMEQVKCYISDPNIAKDIIDRIPTGNVLLTNGRDGAAGLTAYNGRKEVFENMLEEFAKAGKHIDVSGGRQEEAHILACKFNLPSNNPIIQRGMVAPDDFFPIRITFMAPVSEALTETNTKNVKRHGFFGDVAKYKDVEDCIKAKTHTSRELLIENIPWEKNSYHFVGITGDNSFTIYTDSVKDLGKFMSRPAFKNVTFTYEGHAKSVEEILEIAEQNRVGKEDKAEAVSIKEYKDKNGDTIHFEETSRQILLEGFKPVLNIQKSKNK